MLQFIDNLSGRTRLLVICSGLLLALCSMFIGVARIHATGTPVVLATAPVDPRSLLQGDYVVLSYDISRLDASLFDDSLFDEPRRSHQQRTVYVELQPGDPVWTPVRAAYSPFSPAAGNVIIRGQSDILGRVNYGIESFLVPEGDGLAVERLGRINRSRVTVRVLVAPDGAALPQNILIDGKPAFTDAGL